MKTKTIIISIISIIIAIVIIIPAVRDKKAVSQSQPATITDNNYSQSDNSKDSISSNNDNSCATNNNNTNNDNNIDNNVDNNSNNNNTDSHNSNINNNSNTNSNSNSSSPSSSNSSIDYSKTGSYNATSIQESDYTIFYPKNIDSINNSLPLITWGNGMGTTPSVYQRLISHIVSHGYIVVASNSGYVGSGSEMIAAIDYMDEQNSNSSSTFYNKIDMSNVGATGHSLGGRGTLNTASNDSRIKCIVPIQPAGADNISKVTCPMFLITSTNDTVLASDSFVTPLYNGSNVPTVYASLSGEPHTAPVTCCQKLQGYVTAFLSIYLKSDSLAKNYFIGHDSLISQDSNWTNIQIKNY